MKKLIAKFCSLFLMFTNLFLVPSCGTTITEFKFIDNSIYMPIGRIEDFNKYVSYDSSVLLPRDIAWTSSDSDTIYINSNGIAQAKKATNRGEVITITAVAAGNKATVSVVVGDFYFASNVIILEEGGDSIDISDYIIASSDRINSYISYTINDTSVAKITTDSNGNGQLNPISEGVTRLYAETKAGTSISTLVAVNKATVHDYTLKLNKDEVSYTISNYIGTDQTIVLPRYYNGYPITTASEVFSGKNNIVSVTIPDTYTTIKGEYFCYDCYVLSTLIISDNVVNIEDYIYKDCPSLESESNLNKVGALTYFPSENFARAYLVDVNPSMLSTTIEIDYTCIAVTNHAFHGEKLSQEYGQFQKLEFISEEGVSNIRCISNDAFSDNPLVKDVNLPEGLIYIHKAFRNLQLETLYLPSTLRYVDSDWLENTVISGSPEVGEVMSEDQINNDSNICFNTYNQIMYLGNPNNRYLYCYRVIGNYNPTSVTLHRNCKIIGPKAFIPWGDFQGDVFSNLSQINPTGASEEADRYNRLYTIDPSVDDANLDTVAVACICKDAFSRCNKISNLILSAFVEYFDATNINEIGSTLNYIFCERNRPTNYYTSIDGDSPKYLFYSEAPIYDQVHWHYSGTRIIPEIWLNSSGSKTSS